MRLSDAVASRCRHNDVGARTLSLKIKYADFRLVTRSVSVALPVTTASAIVRLLEPLLRGIDMLAGVRLIGVSARNLIEPTQQMSLFDTGLGDQLAYKLDASWTSTTVAIDQIRDRFGESAIKPATALGHEHDPSASKWGPSDPKSK